MTENLLDYEKEILEICKRHGVTKQDVFSRSRKHHITMVRHKIFVYLYDKRDWSFPKIGKLFGMECHTTVLHGIYLERKRQAIAELEEGISNIDEYHEAKIPVSEETIKKAIEHIKTHTGKKYPVVLLKRDGSIIITYKPLKAEETVEFKSI